MRKWYSLYDMLLLWSQLSEYLLCVVPLISLYTLVRVPGCSLWLSTLIFTHFITHIFLTADQDVLNCSWLMIVSHCSCSRKPLYYSGCFSPFELLNSYFCLLLLLVSVKVVHLETVFSASKWSICIFTAAILYTTCIWAEYLFFSHPGVLLEMVLKFQSSKKISPSLLVSGSHASLIEFYTLHFWFHKAFIISLQRSKVSRWFLSLLHCGNLKKFGWLHTMIVQMAFCLWVDSNFTWPNQILLDLWTNLVSVLYGI